MNILFICNTSPFNTDMGNAQRTSIILKAFLNNGCNVDIFYVGVKKEIIPNILPPNVRIVYWNDGHVWEKLSTSKWKERFIIHSNDTSYELENLIRSKICEVNYDFIFCRYIMNARLAGIFNLKKKIILDIDDLPEIRFINSIPKSRNIIKKIYHKYIFHCIKSQTKKCIEQSYSSFLPNKKEAQDYKAVYLPNISTIYKNDLEEITSERSVLFIGYMSWAPNYMGVDHFITNCWNDVIKHVPDAHLVIAGKGLPEKYNEKWKRYKNVDYIGFVEDIYKFYEKGKIVICPIYAGAGTNIKVIEAMSMSKACVLSSHGTRGYEDILKHSYNAMIAGDNASFSQHIVQLLSNNSYCNEIAKNAFKTAESYFSQKTIDSIISGILKK